MRAPLHRLVTAVAAALAATAMMAVAAGPAHAVSTWHSNKGVVYPSWTYPGGWATAPTASDWVIGGVTVSCFSGWAVGTLVGTPSATGVTGPGAAPFAFSSATPKFASCLPTTVACQGDKVFPVGTASLVTGAPPGAYNSGTATTYAGAASRRTAGTMAAIDCEFRDLGVLCLRITGSVPISYLNPSAVGGTLAPIAIVADTALDAVLTVRRTGQALTAVGPGCAVLPNPGAGTIRLEAPGGTDLAFGLSGGIDQPVLWYGTL